MKMVRVSSRDLRWMADVSGEHRMREKGRNIKVRKGKYDGKG